MMCAWVGPETISLQPVKPKPNKGYPKKTFSGNLWGWGKSITGTALSVLSIFAKQIGLSPARSWHCFHVVSPEIFFLFHFIQSFFDDCAKLFAGVECTS